MNDFLRTPKVGDKVLAQLGEYSYLEGEVVQTSFGTMGDVSCIAKVRLVTGVEGWYEVREYLE